MSSGGDAQMVVSAFVGTEKKGSDHLYLARNKSQLLSIARLQVTPCLQ